MASGQRTTRQRLSILGALGWFTASYGLAIIGYVASNAIASRWLGRGEYGYFVVAVTVSAVIGQLGLLGVHRAGLREAARMGADDDEGMALLRRGVRAVLLVSLPAASIASGLVTYIVSGNEPVKTRLVMAVGFALMVGLGGQQKLWANYLRGFGDVRVASLLEGRSGGAIVAMAQALLLGIVWKSAPDTGLPGAVAALAVGFALPVGWAARRVTRRWQHVHVPVTDAVKDLRIVFHRDWRFALNQFASYLNGTVEIWIAGLFLAGTATSLFGAAQRLALLLVIPLTSLQVVFAPVSARLIAADDIPRLERLLRTGATIAAGVTAVAWVPMLLLPGPMLRVVFGPGFAAAATVLFLLTVGNIANVVSGLCGTALTMSRHEGSVAATQVGALVLRLIAGTTATVLFGLDGLAVSAAVLTVLMYAFMWRLAKNRLGLHTQPTLRPSLKLARETIG